MTTTSPLLLACGAMLALASLLFAPGSIAQINSEASPSGWDGTFYNINSNQVATFSVRPDGEIYLDFYVVPPGSAPLSPGDLSLSAPDWSSSFKARDLELILDLHQASIGADYFGDFVSLTLADDNLRLNFDKGVPLWTAISVAALLLTAGGVAVGLVLTRRERMRLATEAAERQRAFHAREAERSRLARELHDGPLQDVHALRMLSGRRTPEAVDEEAARIARELRAIAEGLRPPALGRFGLSAALSAHANRVKDRHPDVLVKLDLDEDGVGNRALPDIVRSSLFRIVQESITNAIEHGGADVLSVALKLPAGPEGVVRVSVSDNGAGFNWEGAPDLAALADGGHFGLVGMHERAAAIGGTLKLLSKGLDGRGATVEVSLPDPRPAPEAPQRAHHHATT